MSRSKAHFTAEDIKNAKPVKPRIRRILEKKEPQLIEFSKKALVMKGHKTSEVMNEVLIDLSKLLKPNCTVFSRKNEILPFEDSNSVEFLTAKNDCSLFAIGSHTKKRQHNLCMGRTYDSHILDMFEFGVNSETYKSITSFEGMKKAVGSKPLISFIGSQWNNDSMYQRLGNFFMDYFRGIKFDMLSLQGIDNLIVFSVVDGKIFVRCYGISFKKSGTKVGNMISLFVLVSLTSLLV